VRGRGKKCAFFWNGALHNPSSRYYADHVSGFVADVSYEGAALVVGPAPAVAPGPVYGVPSPSPRPPLPPPLPSVTPSYGPPSPAYDGLDY